MHQNDENQSKNPIIQHQWEVVEYLILGHRIRIGAF